MHSHTRTRARTIVTGYVIAGAIFLSPIACMAKEYTLLVSLSHVLQNNSLRLSGTSLIEGRASGSAQQPADGAYTLTVLSRARQQLFTTRFLIPSLPLDAGPIDAKEIPFTLEAPYLLAGNALEIADPQNKIVLSVPIPPLEKLVDQALDISQAVSERKAVSPVSGQVQPAPQNKAPLPIPTPLIFAMLGLAVIGVILIVYRLVKTISGKKQSEDSGEKQL